MKIDYIDDYKISKQIDVGGTSKIYKAEIDDKVFAVKILREEYINDDQVKKTFFDEAEILKSITSRNIVKVHKYGQVECEDEFYPYMIMDFIDGKNLKNFLHKWKKNTLLFLSENSHSIKEDKSKVTNLGWNNTEHLTINKITNLFISILNAVKTYHGYNIIHRDLKPSNMFLTHRNEIKLLDFGTAQHGGDRTIVALSPSYSSPEIVLKKSDTDIRTDIYSIGIMLYQFLTGELPFRGTDEEIQYQQINKAIPEINILSQENLNNVIQEIKLKENRQLYTILDPTCDDKTKNEFVMIIKKATEKDRNLRYNSPDEMINDLENLLTTFSSSSVDSSDPFKDMELRDSLSNPIDVQEDKAKAPKTSLKKWIISRAFYLLIILILTPFVLSFIFVMLAQLSISYNLVSIKSNPAPTSETPVNVSNTIASSTPVLNSAKPATVSFIDSNNKSVSESEKQKIESEKKAQEKIELEKKKVEEEKRRATEQARIAAQKQAQIVEQNRRAAKKDNKIVSKRQDIITKQQPTKPKIKLSQSKREIDIVPLLADTDPR